MKISVLFSYLFVLFMGFGSCQSDTHDTEKNKKSNLADTIVLPEIKDADSATIIYYNNPPNDRFFKVVKGKKPAGLEIIIKDVNETSQKVSQATCLSFGKIYFYKGTEQVYIIYFSDKKCSKLAFIKNGVRYESKMSEASSQLLEEWKAKATEPLSR